MQARAAHAAASAVRRLHASRLAARWTAAFDAPPRCSVPAPPSLLRAMSTSATTLLNASETIYALSTPPGKSAVAVVRLTGPAARDVLAALLGRDGRLPSPRQAALRALRHPASGELLDKALVLWLPGPGTFTGEDMVELHLHGSRAVTSGVLRALAGEELGRGLALRPARPGEFTQRAFYRNKLDLTEVEGLADLLDADTDAQRRLALAQMGGSLSRLYDCWRASLIQALAHVEAVIDFGEDEDDCDDDVYAAVETKLRRLVAEMEAHLADGRRGEILRDGVQVAIVGPPNAGKSSLLNELAGRPAAIVSSIPGTTRDIVEVSLDCGGVPLVVSDTAGIRTDVADAVEAEGVRRARERLGLAHVRLCVFDVRALDELTGLADLVTPDALVILNKCDEEGEEQGQGTAPPLPPVLASHPAVFRLSCKTRRGVDGFMTALEAAVKARFWSDADGSAASSIDRGDTPLITRQRHRHHLRACVDCLHAFLARPYTVDLAAEELRYAVRELAAITGRVDVEDILDVIFSDFCIGK